jgi:histidinol phosphatase-like PHP family hydrolase
MRPTSLTNADLVELLARRAEQSDGLRQRAFRRASRCALLWPEEAVDLIAAGRPLIDLKGVGPFLASEIEKWLNKPPADLKPPELRFDFITLAEARRLLASNPAWRKRLRGDLQMHTQWSDGSGTIAEMAAAAAERVYEFIAITDHSKGLKIAGGMDEAALARQGLEIDLWNHENNGSSVEVLKSIEMNLSPTGQGDMDRAALGRLDLVLGSFHSALRKKEDQTQRYLAAVANPEVDVLGHPRGRIYNFRLGLKADWARVFAEAAKRDKAVEIDSYPDRQDLNLSLLKIARKEGVRISLGTDAHHPWQLEFIELGLAAALKAKLSPDRVINFLSVPELLRWCRHES